jgi:hypothetical protein
MKLEPLNRSQLVIKSSKTDDQEPVNMSKKEMNDDDEENDEDEIEDDESENHHQSTHNLLTNVSSPVHA